MDNTVVKKRKSRYDKPHINEYWMINRWPQLQPATEVHLDFKKPNRGNLLLPVQLMRKCGIILENGFSVAVFQNRMLIRNTKGGKRYYQEENKNVSLKRTGLPKETLDNPIAWVMGNGFLVGTTHPDAAKLGENAQFFERERITRITYDKCVDEYAEAYPLENENIIGWKDSKLFYSARASKIASIAGYLWGYVGLNTGDPLCISRYSNCTVIERWSESSSSPAPHSVLRSGRGVPSHYFGVKTVDLAGESVLRVIVCKNKLILAKKTDEILKHCTPDKRSRFPVVGSGYGIKLPAYDDANLVVKRKHTKNVSKKNVLNIPFGILDRSGIPVDSFVTQTRYDGVIVLARQDTQDGKIKLVNRRNGVSVCLTRGNFKPAATVQVFEADGCVVISRPGADLGVLVTPPEKVLKQKRNGTPAVSCTPLDAKKTELLLDAAEINGWTDLEVFNKAVIIRGKFLAQGRFEHVHHVKVSQYENAICLDPRAESEETVAFGVKDSSIKYRIINLNSSLLADATIVRAIIANGRLVLVDPASAVGLKCTASQAFKLPPMSQQLAHNRTLSAVAQSVKLKKRCAPRKSAS